jgi:ATP-dependent DNA ligase
MAFALWPKSRKAKWNYILAISCHSMTISPPMVKALTKIKKSMILDGEVVVVDQQRQIPFSIAAKLSRNR